MFFHCRLQAIVFTRNSFSGNRELPPGIHWQTAVVYKQPWSCDESSTFGRLSKHYENPSFLFSCWIKYLIDKNEECIERLGRQTVEPNAATYLPTNVINDKDDYIPTVQPISYIQARVIHYSPFTKIRQIKASYYGLFSFLKFFEPYLKHNMLVEMHQISLWVFLAQLCA